MCYADPGFVTSYWIEGRLLPMPDFNTVHKCRNIDAMLEWVDKNHVPISELSPQSDERMWSKGHHP